MHRKYFKGTLCVYLAKVSTFYKVMYTLCIGLANHSVKYFANFTQHTQLSKSTGFITCLRHYSTVVGQRHIPTMWTFLRKFVNIKRHGYLLIDKRSTCLKTLLLQLALYSHTCCKMLFLTVNMVSNFVHMLTNFYVKVN